MSSALYNSFLVLHIIGITVMAGATFIDFLIFRSFRNTVHKDYIKSLSLEESLFKLQQFIGIGMLLILLSGIGMMVKLHQVWGVQLWFRIKIGILLLIIVNGLWFRRALCSHCKVYPVSKICPDYPCISCWYKYLHTCSHFTEK